MYKTTSDPVTSYNHPFLAFSLLYLIPSSVCTRVTIFVIFA